MYSQGIEDDLKEQVLGALQRLNYPSPVNARDVENEVLNGGYDPSDHRDLRWFRGKVSSFMMSDFGYERWSKSGRIFIKPPVT
jgi:hypothetical protein